MPSRPPLFRTATTISPSPAYAVMLRATSEIAVASRVRSVGSKPIAVASSRASRRAATTSSSDRIAIRRSSDTVFVLLEMVLQERQAFLEVQRGVDVLEVQAELHHRERHLGLDADDHRLGPAQPRHAGDPAHRPRHERANHVSAVTSTTIPRE